MRSRLSRKNPFFEHGEADYFLAERDGEVVGRIAAVANRLHNETHGDRVGFFGFFDTVDDPEVAGALLDAAGRIEAAFEAPESDPKSEALPAIWTDWPGFQSVTTQMLTAVGALDPASLDGVRAGIGPVGKSCGGCHEKYRVKK